MKTIKKFLLRFLFLSTLLFPAYISAATISEEIAGLYIAFFNRAADESGLHYWEAQAEKMGEDTALKTLAAAFASHPKFTQLYKDMSNKEFVEAIYINVLGQAGDSKGIAYWKDLLEKGMSRSDMVANFVVMTLNFDSKDPQYETLRAINTTLNNVQNPLETAQQRKDLFANKVAVSLMYIDALDTKTNLDQQTDAFDPASLNLDKAYRASINLLYSIADDTTTREKALNLLEMIASSEDAINIINRLRKQYGSVLQDSTLISQMISLMENLRIYNNNFGTITSPITGKVWMDRNLGATEICTSSYDEECYGDYYQWGRYPDGHEKVDSSITLKVASSLITQDNKFVISSYDWINKDTQGRYRSQTYNVCPVGFRVPTIEELLAEKISNTTEAFDILKLPATGDRNKNGHFAEKGESGYLLSSSSVVANNYKQFKYTDTYSMYNVSPRTTGTAVRCIKSVEPIQWVTGTWGKCQGICGISFGVQSRSVTCQDATGTPLPDSYCIDPKPISSQRCEMQSCANNLPPVAVDDFEQLLKPSIAVFDNPNYVDSLGNSASESDNIQATLTSLNYNNLAFTDTTVDGLQTALTARQILLMPENEQSSAYSNLPADTKSFIYDFVSNGKTLIINSDGSGKGLRFLNEIFGWSLQAGERFADQDDRFQKTVNNIGTPYENAPDMIPGNDGTYTVSLLSLPMNSKVYYIDDNNNVAVFSKDVGAGHVIFLAYDWFNAVPVGIYDGGWVDVLNASVLMGEIPVAYTVVEANETNPSQSVSGNVLDNDSDPDTSHEQLIVIHVNSTSISDAGTTTVNGLYGSLTIDAKGAFTYDLNNSNPTVNALKEGETLEDIFTYTISDNESEAKTDSATLNIKIDGVNDAPTANAGANQNVIFGAVVQLDGNASSDPEGDVLTYLWSIDAAPAGSVATLSDTTAVNPTFTPDVIGDYNIRLVVNDGKVDSLPDSMHITVTPAASNVALNKNVTMLTAVVLGSSLNITNGSYADVCYSFDSSSTGYRISFEVDLSTPHKIEKIIFSPIQTRDYIIESSLDGVTWTTRNNVFGLDYYHNTIQSITISPSYTARYIRYTGINYAVGYAGVKEFEVHGIPSS